MGGLANPVQQTRSSFLQSLCPCIQNQDQKQHIYVSQIQQEQFIGSVRPKLSELEPNNQGDSEFSKNNYNKKKSIIYENIEESIQQVRSKKQKDQLAESGSIKSRIQVDEFLKFRKKEVYPRILNFQSQQQLNRYENIQNTENISFILPQKSINNQKHSNSLKQQQQDQIPINQNQNTPIKLNPTIIPFSNSFTKLMDSPIIENSRRLNIRYGYLSPGLRGSPQFIQFKDQFSQKNSIISQVQDSKIKITSKFSKNQHEY